jgi:hypothetical protein
MRNATTILIVGGIAGFLYCSIQLSQLPPVPEDLSISRSLEYPAGQMEMGRYVSAAAAFFGVLTLMVRR